MAEKNEVKNKIITKGNKTIYVRHPNTQKDFHTEFGIIYQEEFKKNGLTETHNGAQVSVYDASFADDFSHLKRKAQIITMKDAAVILAETGITKDSVVFDAGSGSGGLACFLGKHAKQVFSFDIRDDHLEYCNKNKDSLGIDNVQFNKCDIEDSETMNSIIGDVRPDVFVIDMPAPTKAIPTVKKFLKVAGYFVAYTPQITQAKEIVNALEEDDSFRVLCAKEILHRQWDLSKRKAKPLNLEIGHTAFLVFARKIHE
jgi:tRNA (adenine57-N1/adenine58-N1)-methyltransferase